MSTHNLSAQINESDSATATTEAVACEQGAKAAAASGGQREGDQQSSPGDGTHSTNLNMIFSEVFVHVR